MKSKIYHPSCEEYTACLQRGGSPFYNGSVMQRGYGIGGLFKGIATTLLPLLPKIGKFVGKTALGVVSDKLSGVPLSKSVKKRSVLAGKKLLLNALSNGPHTTNNNTLKRNKRKRTRVTKRIRTVDAFGTV